MLQTNNLAYNNASYKYALMHAYTSNHSLFGARLERAHTHTPTENSFPLNTQARYSSIVEVYINISAKRLIP